MEKVFIVAENYGNGDVVEAVFTTIELAQQYIDKFYGDKRSHPYGIVEYILNPTSQV